MTQPSPQPPQIIVGNGVSFRDVSDMVDKAKNEIKAEIRNQFAELKEEIRIRDEKRDEHDKDVDQTIEIIKREIYGEGESKGLRVKVSDLERNTGILHGIQAAVTAIGMTISAWIGRQ